jgi:hypothetical protein
MKRRSTQLITAVALAGMPIAALLAAPEAHVQVRAGSLPLVRTIDERFQSFQIGFSHLTGGETWKSYDALPKGEVKDVSEVREARAPTDLTNRRLRNLTAALAPLYLRYSGTTANSVYFHNSDTPPPAKAPEGYTVLLTRERWKEALDFAKAVNAKVLTSFTNSEGVRDGSHAWTPKMAAQWMAYTRRIGGHVYAAELFNEPNAPEPPRVPKGFSAEDFARDFAAFRAFMMKAAPEVKLAGPGNATLGVPVSLRSWGQLPNNMRPRLPGRISTSCPIISIPSSPTVAFRPTRSRASPSTRRLAKISWPGPTSSSRR